MFSSHATNCNLKVFYVTVFKCYVIFNLVQIVNSTLLLIHRLIKQHNVTHVDYQILHRIFIFCVYWVKFMVIRVFVNQHNTYTTRLVNCLFLVNHFFSQPDRWQAVARYFLLVCHALIIFDHSFTSWIKQVSVFHHFNQISRHVHIHFGIYTTSTKHYNANS